MKNVKKCFLVMLLVLCLFTAQLGSVPVRAADPGSCRLTVEYGFEGTAIPGAEFSLYRMGDADDEGNFTLTGAFAAYPVKVERNTADEWKALATTLKGYVERDGLRSDYTGTTDETGVTVFDNLPEGIYLVIGAKTSTEDYTYFAQPIIAALPAWDQNANAYLTDNTIFPKVSREENIKPEEPVSRKVVKIWSDNANTAQRPKSIKVDLLADGTVYDTVTLSYDSDWRYSWDELPASDGNGNKIEWSVVEHIENGSIYSVKIERIGATFTITNTCVLPTPTPPPELPKTGQDWWAVPLLLSAGFVFLLIGIVRRKSVKE